MEKRSILFYWLLILIPAIIIGSAAFKLLYHEQERINNLAITTIEDRIRTIGETIQLTIEAVENELTQSLLDISNDKLKETLLDQEENNPLARNVFIWDERSGLKYPVPGLASTSEERRFVSRFDGLFSGRISWPSKSSNIVSDQSEIKTTDLVQNIRNLNFRKQELLEIVQRNSVSYKKVTEPLEKQFSKGGWIPWFAENKLYILGWVNKKKDGPIYGIELELMTLLSRLIIDFPQISSGQSGYALIDDSGRLLHQTGNIRIDNNSKPLTTISLAPHLPHWALAVYMSDENSSARAGNDFMILACLLLIIFLVAIAAGGFLLMRHAKQNVIDAQQKTSFVSNVSHELKTPLTSIRMFAELLLEGRAKDQDKKQKYLRIIVSESRRLTRLVNNVLNFSHLEEGRKKYHIEDIDLKVLLSEIMEFYLLRIKNSNMEASLNVPDENIIIKTDRDALEQVILNFIDNAIKYASDGKEISTTINVDINNVEIKIEDRGPGIPEKHRKKIFNKFHRVDDTLTATKQGSGLGLSIAKRMLKDMGGDLYYESRQGGGSCFTVKLPMNQEC